MGSIGAGRRPTIIDVATAAGVSRGTVSRVINGGRWVSPAAQKAVEQAIRTTGYRANRHARSLVTGKSNSVAFLLTEPANLLFTDPTFSLLLRGAAEALAERQMTLILLVAGTPTERENVAAYVAASRVHEKRHFVSDVSFGAVLGIVAGRTVTVGRGDARFAVGPMATPGGGGVAFTWLGHR